MQGVEGPCKCGRQPCHAIGTEHEFHVVVLQIFRTVVAHHHVDGAVKHGVAEGPLVFCTSQRRQHPKGSLESPQIFVTKGEVDRRGATGYGKAFGLGDPHQIKAFGRGQNGEVQPSTGVPQNVQVSRHTKRLSFRRDACQSHFRADNTLVHDAFRVQIEVQWLVHDRFAMGLGVGKRPLQHPHTMQRPVVGESHCTCLAQVMHLGQLRSLASFCDAGHWKQPRRDAMFMGSTGFGHDMVDSAGMVRGRRVGRQQGDVRES